METLNGRHDAEPQQANLFKQAADELARRVRRGDARVCEQLFADQPCLTADKEGCLELLYTEFVLRQEQGESSEVAEWIARFPAWEADIRELFEVHHFVSREEQATCGTSPATAFDSWWFDEQEKPSSDHRQLGSYELLEEIGRGGMGIVFRARHVTLDRQVALKTLRGPDGFNPEILVRFRAEAEAAARLQHPNIVQIYEVGLHQEQPYFTMEYVAGGNLAAVIRQHPLSPRTAASLLAPVARAIHYAHERAIVHRDLKPANLLLAASKTTEAVELSSLANTNKGADTTSRYELKITDFGLAKRLDSNHGRTMTGAALGTPSYMSPEQASNNANSVGPACDIYALGAVLYDMLVGRPPFHAATIAETLERVRRDDPISIRNIQPNVPRDLETICLKCLQKDPARRYSSAAALADDLERFLKGQPILARPVGPVERTIKWTKRHPAIAAFIIAIGLGALGIGYEWYQAEANRIVAEHQAALATDAQAKEHAERERLERTLYAHDVSLANFEYLSDNTTRARQLLASCQPDLRGWEWKYLQQTMEQQQQWESDNFDMPIRSVALSPDHTLVAGAGAIWGTDQAGVIRVWNHRTKELVHRFTGHPNSVMDICFSPDGRRLASVGTVWQRPSPAGGMYVWDLATSRSIWSLENVNAHSVAYSPDGRTVVIGNLSGKITLHDAESGQLLRTCSGHNRVVFDISFRPDGKSFATASRDGSLRVWNSVDGQQIAAVTNLADVRSVSCSPNGTDIAVGIFGGNLKIFTQVGSELQETFGYHYGEQLTSVRFSPDGQYLAVTAVNDAIKLIDPKTGETVRDYHGHNGAALDSSFSTDGRTLVTSGQDGQVNLWDLLKPSRSRKQIIPGPFLADMAFLPQSGMVAIPMGFNNTGTGRYEDRTIKLWNSATGQIERSLTGHTDWLTSVAADPQGEGLLSGSHDKTAILWHVSTGKPRLVLRGHDASIMDVDYLKHGNLAVTVDQHGEIRTWNTEDGQQVGQWKVRECRLHALACHPDEPTIFFADVDGDIWCWQVDATMPDRQLLPSAGPIYDLCFSADGNSLAAAHQDGTITLWRNRQFLTNSEPQPPSRLRGHTASVTGIGFSPDGRRLISTGVDRTVKLWDVESGLEVMSIPAAGKSGVNSRIAFCPNAQRIVHFDGTAVEVWEVHETADFAGATSVAGEPILGWHQAELRRAAAREYWSAIVFHCRELIKHEPPDSAKYRLQCGEALARLDRWEEAVSELEALLTVSPSPRAFATLAYYYLYHGDAAGHRRTCERYWTHFESTKNANGLNNLAWACVLAPGVLPEYPQLARRMEEFAVDSQSPVILNTLGAVYLRMGQFEQAIATLERAIRLQPNGGIPQDWLLLSLALGAHGQYEASHQRLAQVQAWLAAQDHKRATRQQLDPLDTWTNRQEIQLLLREAQIAIPSRPADLQPVSGKPFPAN